MENMSLAIIQMNWNDYLKIPIIRKHTRLTYRLDRYHLYPDILNVSTGGKLYNYSEVSSSSSASSSSSRLSQTSLKSEVCNESSWSALVMPR